MMMHDVSCEPGPFVEADQSRLFSLPHAFPSLNELEGPRVREVDRNPSGSEMTTEDVCAKLLSTEDSPRKARLLSSAFIRAKSERLLLGSPHKYKQLNGAALATDSVEGLSLFAVPHFIDEDVANGVANDAVRDSFALAGISWDSPETKLASSSPSKTQQKPQSLPLTTGGLRKSLIIMSPMRLMEKKFHMSSGDQPVSPRSNPRNSPRNSPRSSPRARIDLSHSLPGESPRRGNIKTLSIPTALAFSDDPFEEESAFRESNQEQEKLPGGEDSLPVVFLSSTGTSSGAVAGDCKLNQQRRQSFTKAASVRGDFSGGRERSKARSNAAWKVKHASQRFLAVEDHAESLPKLERMEASDFSDGSPEGSGGATDEKYQSPRKMMRDASCRRMVKAVSVRHNLVGSSSSNVVVSSSGRSSHLRNIGTGRKVGSENISTHFRKSVSVRELGNGSSGNIVGIDTDGKRCSGRHSTHLRKCDLGDDSNGCIGGADPDGKRSTHLRKSGSGRRLVHETPGGTDAMTKMSSSRNLLTESNYEDIQVHESSPEKVSRRACVGAVPQQTPRRMAKAASVRNIRCTPSTNEKPLLKSLADVDIWNSVPAIPGVPAPPPSADADDQRRRLTRDPLNKSMRARGVLLGSVSERHLQVGDDVSPKLSTPKHRAGNGTGSQSPRSPRRKIKIVDAEVKIAVNLDNGSSSRLDGTTTTNRYNQDRTAACRVLSPTGEDETALDLIKVVTGSPRHQQRQKMIVPSREDLLQAVASTAPELLVEPEKPNLGRKLIDGLLGRPSHGNSATRHSLTKT